MRDGGKSGFSFFMSLDSPPSFKSATKVGFVYASVNWRDPHRDRLYRPDELVLLRTEATKDRGGMSRRFSLEREAGRIMIPQGFSDGGRRIKVAGMRAGDVDDLLRSIGFAGRLQAEAWRTKPHHNIVTNEGLAEILKSSHKDQALYFVLSTTASPAAGWTMANGNGGTWTQSSDYSEANRVEFTDGTITGTTTASVDNVGNEADHSINGTVTIQSGGLTTNNTKGGTTGELISMAAPTEGARSVVNGDTLQATGTATETDDGV